MATLLPEPPKGAPHIDEIWRHTASGALYIVNGMVFNTITDAYDVHYVPFQNIYQCGFTRQIEGHPKAFLSTNEHGEPRFTRVK